MGSAVLLGGRFVDVQDLRFQTAKRSVIGCAELQGGIFTDCQEGVFKLQIFQI